MAGDTQKPPHAPGLWRRRLAGLLRWVMEAVGLTR